MTLWKNLVVALVAAFALAACSSSNDNGGTTTMDDPPPTQDELDAAVADKEQAEADRDKAQNELEALKDKQEADREAADAKMARAIALELSDPSLGVTVVLTDDDEIGSATFAHLQRRDGTTSTGDLPTFNTTAKQLTKDIGTLHGWSGTEFTVKDGTTADTVRIYTNKGQGDSLAFDDWAALTAAVTPANDGNVTIVAAHSPYIKGSPFASGTGEEHHEDNRNTDTTPGADVYVTAGTFAGAQGEYRCVTTATCASRVSANGQIELGTVSGGTFTVSSTEWTFDPEPGATAHLPDSSFEFLGWWLRTTDGAHTIDAFHGDTHSETVTLPVGGKATYVGPAVGKYAIYESGWKAGHFEAQATLEAEFGAGPRISGEIDSFDGDSMGDWKVTLPALTIGDDGAFNAAVSGGNNMPIWAIGEESASDETGSGSWSGQLNSMKNTVPQAATGTFTVDHGNVGHMSGAFGASKQ